MILASPKERLAEFLQSLPFSVAELPDEACLVGGAVRDALLQRQSDYIDFDFVLPEKAVETARDIAKKYHAGFVVLDEARQIARVVFRQGTLDFALQEGGSLERDLRRRDYCANAIAYHIRSNSLVDPLNGLADLENRVLRMVTPENLADDPLRLLRAYRQAAQLGFRLDGATRHQIQRLAPLIKNIAAERVQHELNYLLRHRDGDRWLALAFQDGLFSHWLPGADQISLERAQGLTNICATFAQVYPQFTKESDWLALAKLACLVGTDPEKAHQAIACLKYSRHELRTIGLVLEMLPQLLRAADQPLNLREQYFFFQSTKDTFPTLALVAQGFGLPSGTIEPLLKRYFTPQDPVAHPVPLLSGKDLIRELHLSPSPQIGQLLTEIQIAHIEGKVRNKAEAIAWGRDYLC
ncbi:tRNA nucleotidyltransferase/poly(A) polymerase [[Synechococcus] sp. NIES-970]|nr:tRNA nucleotidyltransferase/poly(A) polymerase [[Synechococcus] sp. NIES-970]